MIDLGTHNVLGIPISAVDYAAAVARITSAATAAQPLAVSATAVHGLMTGVLDREHGHRLSRFDLLVPDGQPVRWALRWLHGVKLPDRVYGPNLMLAVCEAAVQRGLPIFLFGGTGELLAKLSANLIARYPQLKIAGCRPSKFRRINNEERRELIADIRASGAQITFVGLGCPRQEVWTYEFNRDLSMPAIAVGAAFNFHAGLLEQAPPWLQKRGLEWAYRLSKEPLRLWRRYLLLNPLFLTLLAAQRLGIKRFETGGEGIVPTPQLYG